MKRGLAATVALALALSLAACGGGDTTVITSVVSEPSTSTTAPTRHLESFQTADHDIGCIAIGHNVRCDIRNRSWSPPPRPADCPGEVDFGQGIEVGKASSRFVCAGDTALNPSATVLADGTTTGTGDITCEAGGGGITCASEATGHGFFLSSARYRLF